MAPWSSIVSFLTFFNFIFNLFSIAIVYMKRIVIFVYTKTIDVKKQLETAIKNRDNEQVTDMLDPVINMAKEAILRGTLIKNVILSFTNKGISKEAAENIVQVAKFRAEEFMTKKAK